MHGRGVVRSKLVALPQHEGPEDEGHEDGVDILQSGIHGAIDGLDALVGTETEGDDVAEEEGRLGEGEGESVSKSCPTGIPACKEGEVGMTKVLSYAST